MMQKFKAKNSLKTKSSSDLILLNNYFATLVNETNEYYEFEFNFGVKWVDLIKNDVENFSIDIYNFDVVRSPNGGKSLSPQQKLFKVNNKPSYESGVSKINSILENAKSVFNKANEADDSRIATSGKQPIIIPQLKNFLNSLRQQFQSDNEINESLLVSPNPILVSQTVNPSQVNTSNNFSTLSQSRLRFYNLSLISENLRDPASVFYVDTKNIDDLQLKNRINDLSNYYSYNAVANLPQEEVYFSAKYLSSQKLEKFYRSSTVKIPKNLVTNNVDVFISFYTKIASGGAGDIRLAQTKRKLEIKKHSTYFGYNYKKENKSTSSQVISSSPKFATAHFLLDKNSNGIKLESKKIDRFGDCSNTTTNLIAANNYSSVIPLDENYIIQRSFSTNTVSNSTSQYFESCVVGVPNLLDTTIMEISKIKKEKTTITLTNIPQYAVAGKIEKSVLNNSQSSTRGFELFQTFEFQIQNQNYFSVDDPDLDDKKTYRYSVFYNTVQGTQKASVTSFYEHFSGLEDTYDVSTEITDFSVGMQQNEPSVTFQIKSSLQESSIQEITKILNAEFNTSVTMDTDDQFANLISHQVIRFNKTKGIREKFANLGTSQAGVAAEVFTDTKMTREYNKVSMYDPTNSYVYEIGLSIHPPQSLMKDIIVEGTTPYGKKYFYKPYRWYQERTRVYGTLFSEDANEKIYVDNFRENYKGVNAVWPVPPQVQLLEIKNLLAERLNKNLVRISWKNSALDYYDHFVVVKEVAGVKRVLGSVVTNEIFDDLKLSELDVSLNRHEFGTVIYYVTPVFKDFSVGNSTRTNAILVDPVEFQYIKFTGTIS